MLIGMCASLSSSLSTAFIYTVCKCMNNCRIFCVCAPVVVPPLLLSLAYPGAYPVEKTDELVKAV